MPVDCPRFSRQFPASRRGGFERLGTDAADMAVAAGSVVEDLDIFEDDVGSSKVNAGEEPRSWLREAPAIAARIVRVKRP